MNNSLKSSQDVTEAFEIIHVVACRTKKLFHKTRRNMQRSTPLSTANTPLNLIINKNTHPRAPIHLNK